MEKEIPKESEIKYPIYIKSHTDIYKIFDESKCLEIDSIKLNISVYKERSTLISILLDAREHPTKNTYLITEEEFITAYSRVLVELNSLVISQKEINCKF